ncbi:MAG: helix-hairpin-helix domain-containing protein [Legionellaceae bacterium]|nr:helix-hairpin-helix domain-containing protein [Legionellaceae bacterium]
MVDRMGRVAAEVAARFRLSDKQVKEAISLLSEGESVPFIARYRKLQTGEVKAAPLRQLLRQLESDAKQRLSEEKKRQYATKPQALKTSQDVLLEKVESSGVLSYFRDKLWDEGIFSSVLLSPPKAHKKARKNKNNVNKVRWAEYVYDKTPIQSIPARRLHVLLRGRREHALSLHIAFPDSVKTEAHLFAAFSDETEETMRQLWKKKLLPQLEVETLARLRTRSDDEMIYGIEKHLQSLLLAPKAPLGIVMGLYAERRQGLGVAVIDKNGNQLDGCTLFPFAEDFRWHDAIKTLAKYVAQYEVSLVGIANGTSLQETKRLLAGFEQHYQDMPITSITVDEAGMLRDVRAEAGAASIARRLQSPLSELLKVPVKQMQFGDVQEEVNPNRLASALKGVIEDTVNRIGVDVNTAPIAVLCYVSGFDRALAESLVAYREKAGFFKTREDLKQVPGMDEKRFEQSAGFLRVLGGENALDETRVHPKDYALLNDLDAVSLEVRQQLEAERLPWRDPRRAFKRPQFKSHVTKLQDLKVGMTLEGSVSRITSFGAFIDVGIQQMGLLHISALAERFVRDPHEVLCVGDVVRVHVLQVDVKKAQIALGMKAQAPSSPLLEISKKKRKNKSVKESPAPVLLNTAMADAFAKLKRGSPS